MFAMLVYGANYRALTHTVSLNAGKGRERDAFGWSKVAVFLRLQKIEASEAKSWAETRGDFYEFTQMFES